MADCSAISFGADHSRQAALFASPSSNTQAAFDAFINGVLSTATPSQVKHINQTLYPPEFSGTQPYKNQFERLSLLDADTFNVCWTVLLASTYAPRAHNYIFSIPPGFHAQDLAYTYYNGGGYQVNATVARVLQGYVAKFALTGDPNGSGLPSFPNWTPSLEDVEQKRTLEGTKVLNLTNSGFPIAQEPAKMRCEWWIETNFAGFS